MRKFQPGLSFGSITYFPLRLYMKISTWVEIRSHDRNAVVVVSQF